MTTVLNYEDDGNGKGTSLETKLILEYSNMIILRLF